MSASSSPQTPASAPAAKGGFRRALIIIGLSSLSAAVLGIWLVMPLLRGGHDRSELYAMGSCRAYALAQIAYKLGGAGRPAYAHPYPELVKSGLAAGTASESERAWTLAEGPLGAPAHGYLFGDMRTVAGRPIDWSKDFALCATPAKYGGATLRTFIVGSAGTVWAKDLGKSDFVADFPADPLREGWQVAE